MERINIILADDHPLVRRGIKDVINSIDDFHIIDEAESGEEALQKVAINQPDVLITDITMSGISGIKLCEKIAKTNPSTKVLILTMHKDPIYVTKAFEAGAMSYLPKEVDDRELQLAIREVSHGRRYLNDFTSKILANQFIGNSSKIILTIREKEILLLIVNGFSNKQIAEKLIISERTVDTHRTNIMRKLDANNTADLVRIALKRQLV